MREGKGQSVSQVCVIEAERGKKGRGENAREELDEEGEEKKEEGRSH